MHCFSNYDYLLFLSLFSTHVFAHTSHMLDYDDDMSERGCQSRTVTLACVTALASRASCRRSMFLARLRFCVHYCIDRDAV